MKAVQTFLGVCEQTPYQNYMMVIQQSGMLQ